MMSKLNPSKVTFRQKNFLFEINFDAMEFFSMKSMVWNSIASDFLEIELFQRIILNHSMKSRAAL